MHGHAMIHPGIPHDLSTSREIANYKEGGSQGSARKPQKRGQHAIGLIALAALMVKNRQEIQNNTDGAEQNKVKSTREHTHYGEQQSLF